MLIKRTYNVKVAESFLKHPTIWKAISEGNSDIASFKLEDKRRHINLIGYVDGIPIGLLIIHPNRRKEYYCHVHVLPKYRKKHSKEFGKEVIKWVWENTSIDRLYALVGNKHPSVLKFAEYVGFKYLEYTSRTIEHSKSPNKGRWLLYIDRGSINELSE